ncbi:hypothetical protein GCM10025868_38360 [Angustibacter aerolatus]|uniref:Response regulatory domain-containing protein n=1 Tax=Angustibacter aerolatus TaxID=1162965 RepID=A0ABQ6JJZ4_9ACTN|nr:response regulator [Angustibacter aerolatus]GMA88586.1 hypothetical protein GCM10025868_38360 [Angustibacter aerolatus]
MTSTPGTAPEPGQRRVLVVEDEPTIAHAVATRLRAEGYHVDVAGDGPSAVEHALQDPPDAMVLDVMLPGFDGLEVCRRVQAQRPVPVLMLTARDDETDTLVGLGVGADDYMTKPFSMREPGGQGERAAASRRTGPAGWPSRRRVRRRSPSAPSRSTAPSGGCAATARRCT